MRRASAMPLFRRQSAAEQTSLAPHDSKARLQDVTKRRDSWRSHVHRTRLRSACSYSSCKPAMSGVEGPSPRLSLGDSKGVFSSEREYPLCRVPTRCGARSSAAALHPPCALRAQKETALAGCFPPAPEARKLSKLSIWDTYPHFHSFFFG